LDEGDNRMRAIGTLGPMSKPEQKLEEHEVGDSACLAEKPTSSTLFQLLLQGQLCILKKLSQNGISHAIYPSFKSVSIVIPAEIS
jgi:hypothetical protein